MNAPAARPLYFGPDGERLFGWLHPAARHATLGVVVCPPFGYEAVCAHRSLRHIAQAAADAGVPALRVDLAGCGDSQGDDLQGERLSAWRRSVHEAVDGLRRATGVARVALVGLRLGALVAALAALERDDIAGLVAVAPVLRGRAYVRELRVLGGGTPAAEGEVLESAGFLMTAETAAALSAVDLRALTRPPAPQVLVVERDDLPGPADWPAALTAQGARVRVEHWPGYAAMMVDPQRSVVPEAIVRGIAACLAGWHEAEAPLLPQAPAPFGTDALASGGVVETAVRIDTGEGALFGVLTRPVAARPGPAVLMLNAGSVHHIGPNRLWVRLSRDWGARGLTLLRVDLSGIGDSPARPGSEENVVYSGHAARDIAAAVAWLRAEAGATEVHALGLCSGAYHALKAAVGGPALSSTLMINPLTYCWKEGTPLTDVKDYEVGPLSAKYRAKFFTFDPWRRLLRGELDLRLIGEVAWRATARTALRAWRPLARLLHVPAGHDLARELAQAAARGVQLRFVFAAEAPGLRMLQEQGGEAVGRLQRAHQASVDLIPGADHTFTRREAREQLVSVLARHLLPPAA